MATVNVQSLENSATYYPYTVTFGVTTVDQLIAAVAAARGYTANWFSLHAPNGAQLLSGTNLNAAEYALADGSLIRIGNQIANLTKSQRQLAKLELAEIRRKAGGNTSAPYYRDRNNFDQAQLPNPASPPPGLVAGRPWTT